MKKLSEGITLGILGGGQLGRMSALSAARLGIKVVTYCPEHDSPASHVSSETIIGDYEDTEQLNKFVECCDFISFEFENIPIKTVDYISQLNKSAINPSRQLLEVSQDRIKEKTFLNSLGIKTARWSEIFNFDDIVENLKDWNCEFGILKTTRFGYDGKGQIKTPINDRKNVEKFILDHKGNGFILEEPINFKHEMSVIIARDMFGNSACYDLMLNEHKNHILHKTIVNDEIKNLITSDIQKIASKIADAISLIGVLTVELFYLDDGQIIANEIAPRTHNSGHWTIDACSVSQFENHVRCVCGLNVGSTERHSDAEMINLIGADVLDLNHFMKLTNACIHLYGKTEIKDGRKMGHITFLKPRIYSEINS